MEDPGLSQCLTLKQDGGISGIFDVVNRKKEFNRNNFQEITFNNLLKVFVISLSLSLSLPLSLSLSLFQW